MTTTNESSKPAGGALYIYSGECCKARIGIDVGAKSHDGRPLHTGDIVMIEHGRWVGSDQEVWTMDPELTAIVKNQFASFVGGDLQLLDEANPGFVMGIRSAGFNSPEWRIYIVKKYSDVVEGERWPAYGFSYAKNAKADAMLKARG